MSVSQLFGVDAPKVIDDTRCAVSSSTVSAIQRQIWPLHDPGDLRFAAFMHRRPQVGWSRLSVSPTKANYFLPDHLNSSIAHAESKPGTIRGDDGFSYVEMEIAGRTMQQTQKHFETATPK
jgi:hypothetical protein